MVHRGLVTVPAGADKRCSRQTFWWIEACVAKVQKQSVACKVPGGGSEGAGVIEREK